MKKVYVMARGHTVTHSLNISCVGHVSVQYTDRIHRGDELHTGTLEELCGY